jgi:hypothetical protein
MRTAAVRLVDSAQAIMVFGEKFQTFMEELNDTEVSWLDTRSCRRIQPQKSFRAHRLGRSRLRFRELLVALTAQPEYLYSEMGFTEDQSRSFSALASAQFLKELKKRIAKSKTDKSLYEDNLDTVSDIVSLLSLLSRYHWPLDVFEENHEMFVHLTEFLLYYLQKFMSDQFFSDLICVKSLLEIVIHFDLSQGFLEDLNPDQCLASDRAKAMHIKCGDTELFSFVLYD